MPSEADFWLCASCAAASMQGDEVADEAAEEVADDADVADETDAVESWSPFASESWIPFTSESSSGDPPPPPLASRWLAPPPLATRWLPHEDLVILTHVATNGPTWSGTGSLLPGRTRSAVRNRWQRIEGKRKLRQEASASSPTQAVPMLGVAESGGEEEEEEYDDEDDGPSSEFVAGYCHRLLAGAVAVESSDEDEEMMEEEKKMEMEKAGGEVEASEAAQLVTHAGGLALHLSSKSATGYKNVSQLINRFEVRAYEQGKHVYVGRFDTAVDAAVAYARHVLSSAGGAAAANPAPSTTAASPQHSSAATVTQDLLHVTTATTLASTLSATTFGSASSSNSSTRQAARSIALSLGLQPPVPATAEELESAAGPADAGAAVAGPEEEGTAAAEVGEVSTLKSTPAVEPAPLAPASACGLAPEGIRVIVPLPADASDGEVLSVTVRGLFGVVSTITARVPPQAAPSPPSTQHGAATPGSSPPRTITVRVAEHPRLCKPLEVVDVKRADNMQVRRFEASKAKAGSPFPPPA